MSEPLFNLYQAFNSLTLWRGITRDAAVQCFHNIATAAALEPKTPLCNLLPEYNRLAGLLLESATNRHLPPGSQPVAKPPVQFNLV